MKIPTDLKYTKEHEWVRMESDDVAVIGITDFAQSELGEIVYVEIDTIGEHVDKDEVFGTIEAVKTTSELYMPVSGEVIAFNEKIDENEGDDPGLVNSHPYEDGWIIKVKVSDAGELADLMTADAYESLTA